MLLGPPGCGKRTEAAVLAEELAVPVVSTGDLVRARRGGTWLGRSAAACSSAGDLVHTALGYAVVDDGDVPLGSSTSSTARRAPLPSVR